MLFVGVDLHKHTITMVAVDASRKLLHRKRFSNQQTQEMSEFLQSLGPVRVTVEATASYEWFVSLVEPLAERVVLAHPGKLRIIAESTRKSDNFDARVLAEMLALDQIPASYRPTPRQREYRVYVRHRYYLQRRITSIRNKIRRLLSNHNLDRSDLFTRRGQAYLESVPLPAGDRFCIDQLRDQWLAYRRQFKAVNQRLEEFGEAGTAQEREDRRLLRTIPGVGVVTTDVILSELADHRRFSSAKKVASYAGIAPGQRESAGKRKSLHIEKSGSALLRWALVQSSWQLVARSSLWRSHYQKLKLRLGAKKALIAIGRRLLGVCHSLLKNQQPYHESASPPPGGRVAKTPSKTRNSA